MGFQAIDPRDLKSVASSYSYDERDFIFFEQEIWNRMQAYAGGFGQTMVEHLGRTSIHLEGVLKYLGYDHDLAYTLASAFRLHDAGKILQDESLWGLNDKPSDEIRRLRPDHTSLGLKVLEETLEKFPNLKDHPHISIMACFMKYHHERINGKGPQGLSGEQLGDILEIAGIVDCMDGKSIIRAKDQTLLPNEIARLSKQKMEQALRDMTGLSAYTDTDKHKGEFRTDLLLKIIPYYERKFGLTVLPPISQSVPTLAL